MSYHYSLLEATILITLDVQVLIANTVTITKTPAEGTEGKRDKRLNINGKKTKSMVVIKRRSPR